MCLYDMQTLEEFWTQNRSKKEASSVSRGNTLQSSILSIFSLSRALSLSQERRSREDSVLLYRRLNWSLGEVHKLSNPINVTYQSYSDSITLAPHSLVKIIRTPFVFERHGPLLDPLIRQCAACLELKRQDPLGLIFLEQGPMTCCNVESNFMIPKFIVSLLVRRGEDSLLYSD